MATPITAVRDSLTCHQIAVAAVSHWLPEEVPSDMLEFDQWLAAHGYIRVIVGCPTLVPEYVPFVAIYRSQQVAGDLHVAPVHEGQSVPKYAGFDAFSFEYYRRLSDER